VAEAFAVVRWLPISRRPTPPRVSPRLPISEQPTPRRPVHNMTTQLICLQSPQYLAEVNTNILKSRNSRLDLSDQKAL
jgi:hypothetical protein